MELIKEDIYGIITALDENLEKESDEFVYACIVFMFNYTYDISHIKQTLGCKREIIFDVRKGIESANLHAGFLDFLFCENPGLEEIIEFWCIVLVIKGQLKQTLVEKKDQIESVKPILCQSTLNTEPKIADDGNNNLRNFFAQIQG